MSKEKRFDRDVELRSRALHARAELKKLGIQYGAVLRAENKVLHEKKQGDRLYKVANGIVSDEMMTVMLEDLVKRYAIKEVA
jgi:hypothetical protein